MATTSVAREPAGRPARRRRPLGLGRAGVVDVGGGDAPAAGGHRGRHPVDGRLDVVGLHAGPGLDGDLLLRRHLDRRGAGLRPRLGPPRRGRIGRLDDAEAGAVTVGDRRRRSLPGRRRADRSADVAASSSSRPGAGGEAEAGDGDAGEGRTSWRRGRCLLVWCVCSPWSCDVPRSAPVPVLRWRRAGSPSSPARHPRRARPTAGGPGRTPEVEVALGMVVEDRASGFCGDVVTWSFEAVTLRDRRQHRRHFGWKPGGFLLEGRPVTLTRPAPAPGAPAARPRRRARSPDRPRPPACAAASRIWVEGRHDAELVEHVWGDDLRELGIVVEPQHGIDDLVAAVDAFGPSPRRRLGILVDHLVAGSKESRLADRVRSPDVLVTGHPFVDVWAGVRPGRPRPRRLAGRAPRRRLEDRDVPRPSAPTRPGSGRSCATACGPTPTCAPSSSAPSSASSTSSPRPTSVERFGPDAQRR